MERRRRAITRIPTATIAVVVSALLCGCVSQGKRQAETDAAFQAGQDAAFEMLERNGIPVVRLLGPFERSVIPWHADLTLAGAFLEAGYQLDKAPGQILLQRRRDIQQVPAARLLAGDDVPLEPGITIRVIP